MTLNIKFDYHTICMTILREQLDKLGIAYTIHSLGEITFSDNLSAEHKNELRKALGKYGIEILDNPQNVLVQRIKDAITTLVNDSEKAGKYNISTYLSDTLNYSYAHLSSVFSEVTHSSIENFIILKKIDVVKDLIMDKNLTLTEIAHRLNYSSVAHLSAQFKKTTGLTPSSFQRIVKKRKEKGITP